MNKKKSINKQANEFVIFSRSATCQVLDILSPCRYYSNKSASVRLIWELSWLHSTPVEFLPFKPCFSQIVGTFHLCHGVTRVTRPVLYTICDKVCWITTSLYCFNPANQWKTPIHSIFFYCVKRNWVLMLKMFISLCTCLVLRQQWKDEKNALEKQITDLEKKLKGNEENLRKREKEYKKVWTTKRFHVNL